VSHRATVRRWSEKFGVSEERVPARGGEGGKFSDGGSFFLIARRRSCSSIDAPAEQHPADKWKIANLIRIVGALEQFGVFRCL